MFKLSVVFMVLALSVATGCGDDGGNDDVAGAAGWGGAGTSGFAGAGAGGMAGAAGTAGAGGMAGTGGMAGAAAGSPTFSAIFSEIIVNRGCNGTTMCHAGFAGNLTMNDKQATYDALVDEPANGMNADAMPPHCADSGLVRVVPGSPDTSLLMQKLENEQPCGVQMPPGELLMPAQIEQVRMWIANGAMND
jgi:hypothetical protein